MQSLYSIADGDLSRHRHRAGHGRSARSRGRHPVAESDFIFPRHCGGDGPARRGRRAAFVPVLRHPRHRHGGPGEIRRQARSLPWASPSIIVLQAFIIVGGVTRLIP
ncbi:MAG: hypothetical protein ACLTSX_13130 [Collinsella sp.]